MYLPKIDANADRKSLAPVLHWHADMAEAAEREKDAQRAERHGLMVLRISRAMVGRA